MNGLLMRSSKINLLKCLQNCKQNVKNCLDVLLRQLWIVRMRGRNVLYAIFMSFKLDLNNY